MAEDILDSLRSEQVNFVRILWCDNAGVTRTKAAHIGSSGDWITQGVGISPAQQAIGCFEDVVIPDSGLSPVGEVRLIPDWDTFRQLPYSPGHGVCLGDMRTYQGEPWSCCPRHFLRRSLESLANHGYQLQAAFENEFYLLEPDGPVRPSDRSLFAMASTMDRRVDFLDDLSAALMAQGMQVEQYYPESGYGQHEVSIGYRPALEAADRQILFKLTVHAIAHRHRLRSSFLPKIFADQGGSGCHLHLSLWKGEHNVTGTEAGRHFMAGILHHLAGLMALTTPTSTSYRRLLPHHWAGAFACWGWDNREAALRLLSNPGGGDPSQFELKTVDATCNPYLALGAVVAAGLAGLTESLSLPDPVDVDPGQIEESERERRGLRRLPDSLGAALEAFENDSLLPQALGPELFRALRSVRRREWELTGNLTLDQELESLLERF